MTSTRYRAELVAQQVSRTAGRWTAGARMSPSFLIIGAQRCGTTSMYRTLSQHPAALPPVWHKGVHYFDVAYDRGPQWYRGHFPLERTGERAARRAGSPAVTFESSPYYSWHPLAAARIAQDLPGVRLLMLLRDPVERAYSAHAHEIARGFETEGFERALELEAPRLEGAEAALIADPLSHSHAHQHQAYVTRGRYIDQLLRIEAAVGRDRMLVIDSDEFFSEPEPVFDSVLEFLGLPPASGIVFERHNARPRSPMTPELRTSLQARYEEDDERLAAWWGRRPSWRP
jgi:hypothetical protein